MGLEPMTCRLEGEVTLYLTTCLFFKVRRDICVESYLF